MCLYSYLFYYGEGWGKIQGVGKIRGYIIRVFRPRRPRFEPIVTCGFSR